MVSRILGSAARRTLVAAGLVAFGFFSSSARAQEESAFSVSIGVDFTSHFISYGADVWGGGDELSPFSSNSTAFAYATVSFGIADNLSGYVNVWSDLNDNVDSEIGGPIQEIDFNVGLTATFDKLAVTLANGLWYYAGDDERVLDLTLAYDDTGLISDDFAFAPSFNVHWRYEDGPTAETGFVLVPGIKPSFTLAADSKMPVTLAVPVALGWFLSDNYHGGEDSGYGYASIGLVASVPLSFIPAKYGSWTGSASATFFNTNEDVIPGNAEENFVVTALSVSVGF